MMGDYLFELHMHTQEVSPCGKVPAREGIKLYYEKGYAGVCITDHFYSKYFQTLDGLGWKEKCEAWFRGYREALDEGRKYHMPVFLGMEYCFPDTNDDILIYGFDEAFIYNHEDLYLKNEDEIKALAEEYDLLLIQAHPFRKKISRTYDTLVEGFEVFNGNPRHDSLNDKAYTHGHQFDGIMISGSDFHRLEDAGTGGVYLPRLSKSPRELVQMLREIKTPALLRTGL